MDNVDAGRNDKRLRQLLPFDDDAKVKNADQL